MMKTAQIVAIQSVSETLYGRLREGILSGAFPPGRVLRQEELSRRFGASRVPLREAMTRLESYDWPGNVRELENTMERAVALESGREISLRVLPDRIAGYSGASSSGALGAQSADFPAEGVDFEKEIAEAERRYLQFALEKAGGVRTRASELLRISYRSFRHYAKKHNL